jgi:hypothetical protein
MTPDKTRLIEFGRSAIANRHARGLGKPESFDFLGFTHFCATRAEEYRRLAQQSSLTMVPTISNQEFLSAGLCDTCGRRRARRCFVHKPN